MELPVTTRPSPFVDSEIRRFNFERGFIQETAYNTSLDIVHTIPVYKKDRGTKAAYNPFRLPTGQIPESGSYTTVDEDPEPVIHTFRVTANDRHLEGAAISLFLTPAFMDLSQEEMRARRLYARKDVAANLFVTLNIIEGGEVLCSRPSDPYAVKLVETVQVIYSNLPNELRLSVVEAACKSLKSPTENDIVRVENVLRPSMSPREGRRYNLLAAAAIAAQVFEALVAPILAEIDEETLLRGDTPLMIEWGRLGDRSDYTQQPQEGQEARRGRGPVREEARKRSSGSSGGGIGGLARSLSPALKALLAFQLRWLHGQLVRTFHASDIPRVLVLGRRQRELVVQAVLTSVAAVPADDLRRLGLSAVSTNTWIKVVLASNPPFCQDIPPDGASNKLLWNSVCPSFSFNRSIIDWLVVNFFVKKREPAAVAALSAPRTDFTVAPPVQTSSAIAVFMSLMEGLMAVSLETDSLSGNHLFLSHVHQEALARALVQTWDVSDFMESLALLSGRSPSCLLEMAGK